MIVVKKYISKINSTALYCLLAAIVAITVCSKSSFLYPLNDWGDTNCYFIIGKGILKGLVPYRDLYDQKGIIIFAIYSLACLITTNSYFGVYIIEIVAAFLFLYISVKIVSLYLECDRYSGVIAFILAVAVYSSAAMCHGGSAEELLLPAFAYGIYVISKQIQTRSIPGKLEMLIFGLCAGIIFFSKFTLCAIFIPIIIIMMVDAYKNKSLGLLMNRALYFILGCLVITILVLVYFALNGALFDFFNAYFYNNIHNYVNEDFSKQFSSVLDIYLFYIKVFFRKRNILPILLIGLSLIWLFIKKKYLLFICYVLSFAAFFYIEFFVAMPLKYYGIPLYCFCAPGLCFIVELLKKIPYYKPLIANAAMVLFAVFLCYVFTDNKYMMFKDIEDTPQYILAEDIRQDGSNDYSLLVYNSLDEGFYHSCNTLPVERAFIQTNLKTSFLQDEQNDMINDKRVDYIITTKYLCDTTEYEEVYQNNKNYIETYTDNYTPYIICFDDFGYELVDQTAAYFEKKYKIYKLYKRIE